METVGITRVDHRKLVAEFVGTFTMVFLGCSAIAIDAMTSGAIGHPGVCVTFGLTVCIMIYAIGHISGAHFNPAVTIGFAIAHRFPWREVPPYVAIQCLASCSAIALLDCAMDMPVYGETVPAISSSAAFVLEAVFTFILMLVISAVAIDHRAVGQLAGVAIGGAVTACAMVGGPLTGGSMNPARSVGPAIWSGTLQWTWLYVLAPLAGAILASLVYRWMRCSEADGQNAQGCC